MKQMPVAAATVTALVIAAVAYVQGYQAADARRYIAPRTKTDGTLPPFSGAVFAGNTLYLAGEIGPGPTTRSRIRLRPRRRRCWTRSRRGSRPRVSRWTTS